MLKYASILLIDDDEDATFLNKRLIEKLEISSQVQPLPSGKAALEFIGSHYKKGPAQDTMIPALMFLDINMPGMSGYEFLQKFEELADVPKDSIRIYLLTSFSHPADLEESKKFNIDGIITKPLTREKLISLAQEKNYPVS